MLKVGDFYEDCGYHPVLCTEVDGDNICGISLIDGSTPRSCSIKHCGIVKLSVEEAIKIRLQGPSDDKKARLVEFYKSEWGAGRQIWWQS